MLAELPGVLSVAQIGTHLRVLCNEGVADVAVLRRALASADPQAHIETVAPNRKTCSSPPPAAVAGSRRHEPAPAVGDRAQELRQLRRDRITLAMIVGIPVMQLLLFGYAINLNLRHLDAGVADQANSAASRALVQDMVATGVITPRSEAYTPDQLMQALRRGEISVGIVVPADFERRRFDGREAVQVLVDGSDTVVQSAAIQLAQVPLDARPTSNTRPLREGSIAGGPISVTSFYNPQRRSAVNIVPGLIGVILTMTLVMFTAVAVVRERERGNMELLIATPVSRSELMVGKVLPYAAIGLLQTTLVLALGTWLFQVPIRGSLLDIYLAAVLLVLANRRWAC